MRKLKYCFEPKETTTYTAVLSQPIAQMAVMLLCSLRQIYYSMVMLKYTAENRSTFGVEWHNRWHDNIWDRITHQEVDQYLGQWFP